MGSLSGRAGPCADRGFPPLPPGFLLECARRRSVSGGVLSCTVMLSCLCPFPSPCLPLLVVVRLPFHPLFPPAVPCLLLTTSSPLFPPVPFFPLIRSLYLSLFLFLSLSDSCLLCFMPEPDYRHVCCNLVLSCRNLPVYLSLPMFGY